MSFHARSVAGWVNSSLVRTRHEAKDCRLLTVAILCGISTLLPERLKEERAMASGTVTLGTQSVVPTARRRQADHRFYAGMAFAMTAGVHAATRTDRGWTKPELL
jgi:hypothetical protein